MQIVLAGALGEVGTSLGAVLRGSGHEIVPVTSRKLLDRPSGVLSLPEALEVISGGGIDLVVNAGGVGDRRAGARDARSTAAELAAAAEAADVPAVLISTLRVCEGVDGPIGDDTVAQPLTPYAQANAELESAWLTHATATVLRMANYFCTPQGPDSPQSLLLPWSLLSEGWVTGHISVRSGAHAGKTFIDASDVAAALELMAAGRPYGRALATLPGLELTMEQLVAASLAVLTQMDRPCTFSFGSDAGGGRTLEWPQPGWLTERGWVSARSLAAIHQQMHGWLVQWGADLLRADEGRS